MKKYSIENMSIAAAADIKLPIIQDVRGSVWTAEQSAALVRTYLDGGYIPPIVFAETEDGARWNVDGQQRLNALRAGVEKGLIPAEAEVVVAVESVDGEDGVLSAFHRLNSGVPVGRAIVTAAGMKPEARNAIMTLAKHPTLEHLFDATAQARRTGKAADVALSLVAIGAGWDTPDSMSKNAAAALADMEEVDYTAVVDGVSTALDAYGEAVEKYESSASRLPKKDSAVRIAKAVVAACRRKNNTLTILHAAVINGIDIGDAVALYAQPERLEKGVVIEGTGPKGGKVKTPYHWTIGRGSSGNASEFRDRAVIMAALAPEITDDERRYGLVATGDAAPEDKSAISAAAVDAVAAAFGL